MRKLMAVVRSSGGQGVPDLHSPPPVPGLAAYTLDVAVSESPPDVVAVASLWLADGELPDAGSLFPETDVDAYLVDERLQWDYERDWPSGTASPGCKRISFVQRAPSLSHAEFADHWSTVHAPLASKHHPSLWRYVQNVVVRPMTAAAPPVDGIAELSFRSIEDLNDRMYGSAEGRRLIGDDVRRFIDVPKGWRALTTEHVVIP